MLKCTAATLTDPKHIFIIFIIQFSLYSDLAHHHDQELTGN